MERNVHCQARVESHGPAFAARSTARTCLAPRALAATSTKSNLHRSLARSWRGSLSSRTTKDAALPSSTATSWCVLGLASAHCPESRVMDEQPADPALHTTQDIPTLQGTRLMHAYAALRVSALLATAQGFGKGDPHSVNSIPTMHALSCAPLLASAQGFGKEIFTDAGQYAIHFGLPAAEAEKVCEWGTHSA
eukprot:350841-Chlamydomonas_euryale.AAC.14